jgi:CBS domain-containing protein
VLRRVVLARADLHTPVAAFMTPHPVQLPSDAPAYEAAFAMATHAIRHIPVVAHNTLVGVVSERDLFAIQRHGLHYVSRTIATATNLASLQQAAADVRQLTLRLLAQGIAAEPLTRLISALNDRLTQRILALQRAAYDLGDIAWCWIALGSEGRSEQTLSTDQDNALIFLPPPHTAVAVTRERLLPFARSVNNALAQCGFPLCPGNIMASNADWCLSLDEWQACFTAWVQNPVPAALLNAAIFFDFRALDGVFSLAETLRQSVSDLVRARPAFLWQMARNALEVRPPLGLIRDFVTDDVGEATGTIDLKAGGIRLFVDGARILALARGITATNTADRLRAVGAGSGLPTNEIAAYIDAFYFLQMLRLQHQQASTASHAPNRLAPDTLNDLERRILKEALRQTRRLQTRLALDYPA